MSATTVVEGPAPSPGGHAIGDARGSFAATLIALPQALSLGVLAFAPLGSQYIGLGAAAGLIALALGNLAAAAFYAVRCQMVGPRSAATALVAATVTAFASFPGVAANPAVLTGLVFLAIALSGATQLMLGAARLGSFVKFIPYPVIAGFMNGIALTIAISQLRPALGLDASGTLAMTVEQFGEWRPGSVVTASVVVAVAFVAPRIHPRIPVLLAAFLSGIAVHHVIAALDPGQVGQTVGALPGLDELGTLLASPWQALGELGSFDGPLLQVLCAQAFLIAVIGALDTLLAAVACDGVTGGRHDGNRLLRSIGLTNVLGGMAGAMPVQLNSHTPIASHKAGGRTRLATALHGLLFLGVLLGFGALMAGIPLAVLAGVMLYIAWSLVDGWSGELIRRCRKVQNKGEVALTIAVVATVTAVQLAANVVTALVVGVVASLILLLQKLSRSPIRRSYDIRARSSHKLRSAQARARLREKASLVQVHELEGELFFGTAERLQSEVEARADDARFVILDLRRVLHMDATAARVLQLLARRLRSRGRMLVLGDVDADRAAFLQSMGVDNEVPAERWFPDLDRALEWAEDHLLEQDRFTESRIEVPLEQMALFKGWSPSDMEAARAAVERVDYRSGEPIFKHGDPGDALYLVAKGSVSIKISSEGGRTRRISMLTPGVMFGEMALLDGQPRSADAFARGDDVVLYRLSAERLKGLIRSSPELAARLYENLSSDLVHRLRWTTEQLRALD